MNAFESNKILVLLSNQNHTNFAGQQNNKEFGLSAETFDKQQTARNLSSNYKLLIDTKTFQTTLVF